MGFRIKVKTNHKKFPKDIKRLQSKFPKIIDKGLLQAGFQLLTL